MSLDNSYKKEVILQKYLNDEFVSKDKVIRDWFIDIVSNGYDVFFINQYDDSIEFCKYIESKDWYITYIYKFKKTKTIYGLKLKKIDRHGCDKEEFKSHIDNSFIEYQKQVLDSELPKKEEVKEKKKLKI